MPAALLWSAVFAVLLLAQWLARAWLLTRQMRHVARHRERVPAALADHLDLSTHRRAADYTVARSQLALWEASAQTAIVTGWTLLGGLEALDKALLNWLGPGLTQQVALVAAFALIGALLELPLAWWRTFRLEARFGFNRTTLGLWLADGLKATLVAALLGLPLVLALLALMEHAGPWWWVWAWGLWMGFNLLLMVVWPLWIAPLFNRFDPLPPEGELHQRLSALLQRCGLRAQGVYVVDGSRRSAHANAYFTGLGRAKRVVLFDTLLQQLAPAQIEAVLAHELGHAQLRHIPRRLTLLGVGSAVALALLAWLGQQPWFYFGLGVTPDLAGGNAARALLLFLLVLPQAGFWAAPLMAAWSRRDEFAADAYAARHADARALRDALLRLHRDNAATATPDPWYVRFFYSHPPLLQRLQRLPAAA